MEENTKFYVKPLALFKDSRYQRSDMRLICLPEIIKFESVREALQGLEKNESLIIVDDMNPSWISDLLYEKNFDRAKWKEKVISRKKNYFEVQLVKTEST